MVVVLTSPKPPISDKYFKFFNEQKLVDCLLIAGSSLVRAHRIVLISVSSYFEVGP
jgi:BTB/POZ domain